MKCSRCGDETDHPDKKGRCVPCQYEREMANKSNDLWLAKLTTEEKQARVEYCRKWYQANKERRREYTRKWRAENPGYRDKWVAKNREKKRQQDREYYARNREKILRRKKELGYIVENKSLG